LCVHESPATAVGRPHSLLSFVVVEVKWIFEPSLKPRQIAEDNNLVFVKVVQAACLLILEGENSSPLALVVGGRRCVESACFRQLVSLMGGKDLTGNYCRTGTALYIE
jgi:hypothetical protein